LNVHCYVSSHDVSWNHKNRSGIFSASPLQSQTESDSL
jgi:hypothetical protein